MSNKVHCVATVKYRKVTNKDKYMASISFEFKSKSGIKNSYVCYFSEKIDNLIEIVDFAVIGSINNFMVCTKAILRETKKYNGKNVTSKFIAN